jgi:zinc/manganese transport system substrate-binding protein
MTRIFTALIFWVILAMPVHAKVKAVASFSIIGDLVANVGGDRIELITIVGPESDAHAYVPTPGDAQTMAAANVIFVNGLGFEGWLTRLIDASGNQKAPVVVSDGITPESTARDHAHDPHAWQDVANVKIYVRNIAAALCAAEASACDVFTANAKSYTEKLDELDAGIRASIAGIPENRRTIITSHDAFGYYAMAYAITFHAPEGISTDSEASAMDVARLIRQIRADKAAALFVENISDPRLLEQIAAETNLTIGGVLYSDALSAPDGPAATYIKMMQHNTRTLAAALVGQ